jgi:hypothetical protein
LWLAFRRAGAEKDGMPFYWFELAPESVSWGVGIWGENRNMMDRMRRQMEAKPLDFLNLLPCVEEADFVLGGQWWKKMQVPEKIPHELKGLYLMRSLYFSKRETKMQWIYQKTLVNRVFKDFQTMAPVYRMLQGCVGDE